MSKQQDIIIAALDNAIKNDIKISFNGCLFDYSDGNYDKPLRCNALGAILFMHNMHNLVGKDGFSKDWTDVLCKILDVDQFWRHRFTLGFDYGHQITFDHEKDGKTVHTDNDDISKLGIKIAKIYKGK